MGWKSAADQSQNLPWYQYFSAFGKWVLRNMADSFMGMDGWGRRNYRDNGTAGRETIGPRL